MCSPDSHWNQDNGVRGGVQNQPTGPSIGMTDSGLQIARRIVDTLEEKKGEDILLLDLVGVASFTDYFVICSAGSRRTLKALTAEIRKRIKEVHDRLTQGVEGDPESGWILLDYGEVVVHLFAPDVRSYYNLEELWKEGQVLVHVQ